MRLIRRSEQVDRPWKNGGGTTRDIITWPADADLDSFEWRVSMARVAQDGPFSVFPGIDRILTVIEGAGMDLAFGDGRAATLRPESGPFTFSGDDACAARLLDGPVTDLNLMCRRSLWRGAVTILSGQEPVRLDPEGGPVVALMLAGAATAGGNTLASGDGLHLGAGDPALSFALDAGSRGAIIRLRHRGA